MDTCMMSARERVKSKRKLVSAILEQVIYSLVAKSRGMNEGVPWDILSFLSFGHPVIQTSPSSCFLSVSPLSRIQFSKFCSRQCFTSEYFRPACSSDFPDLLCG